MTKFKGLFATAAATAMLTVTTFSAAASAAGNPAASLSIAAPARAGTPGVHGSKLGASVSRGTLISIGVLAALVVIVLVATKNGKNGGSPASP